MKDQEHIAATEDHKEEKKGREQLYFPFFTEEVNASTDAEQPPARTSNLARTVTAARAALLDVPLREVDAQLPMLLEFCEAALTRALDVAQKRPQRAFSDEEYRSLRGIGQAHWLLVERQSREK